MPKRKREKPERHNPSLQNAALSLARQSLGMANLNVRDIARRLSGGVRPTETKTECWRVILDWHGKKQHRPVHAAPAPVEQIIKFVKSDSFLHTYAWRATRMQALKRDGRKCLCCGVGLSGPPLHVDHIHPRQAYPQLALTLDNLQVLCEECNHGKGNWDSIDWHTGLPSPDPTAEALAEGLATLLRELSHVLPARHT